MMPVARFVVVVFLAGLLLPAQGAEVSVGVSGDSLTVENDLVRRTFSTYGSFRPASWVWKESGAEGLVEGSVPWLGIGVDGKTVARVEYVSHSKSAMGHGGVEVRVKLKADSLDVVYVLQAYPSSPLMRERLELRSASARFSKIDGKVRLVFPRYQFRETGQLQEVRMATWNREQVADADIDAFPVHRAFARKRGGVNLSQAHMFHPVFLDVETKAAASRKGPVVIGLTPGGNSWLLAYEHGSPDDDPVRVYQHLLTQPGRSSCTAAVSAHQGAYLDGEPVGSNTPYLTDWAVAGFFPGDEFDDGHAALWEFLYRWQNPQMATRKPVFYYNTWGWQRSDQTDYVNVTEIKDTREGTDVYNDTTVYDPIVYSNVNAPGGPRKNLSPRDVLLKDEDRLLREIDYAAEIGANVFVLDDGWFQWMGDWDLNKEAFPDGIGRLLDRVKNNGMRLGLWLAPTTVDRNAKRHAEYADALVRDKEGKVQIGGWGRDMPCLASRYRDYFVQRSKQLIDLGVTYFKWDGLEDSLCYAANHNHGGPNDDPEERARRYGFEFNRIITDMARELTEYCPELVIVYDVTELNKSGVGLDFLSEGRYFWMNNGGSGYGDFSHYRAKSMRMIPSLYSMFIPPVLLPHANYPHNKRPYEAQEYAVASTLLGGNGFWGDLSEMTKAQRANVKAMLGQYRRAGDSVVAVRPKVTGEVGSSPEIYEYLLPGEAEGQVIAFSGSKGQQLYRTREFETNRLLGVLRHAYTLDDNRLRFHFTFTEPDVSRQAFIVGGNESGASVTASTCWLKDLRFEDGALVIDAGAPGEVTVRWGGRLGSPVISGAETLGSRKLMQGATELRLRFVKPGEAVIKGN